MEFKTKKLKTYKTKETIINTENRMIVTRGKKG